VCSPGAFDDVQSDQPRKLATIVALDVAGYSARTEADEARTTAEVAALRGVIEEIAARHGGRVFNTAGDGFMLEFGSSLAASALASRRIRYLSRWLPSSAAMRVSVALTERPTTSSGRKAAMPRAGNEHPLFTPCRDGCGSSGYVVAP